MNEMNEKNTDIAVRLFEIHDYHKGFLTLLNQLTPTAIACSFETFTKQMKVMLDVNPCTEIYVIEDSGCIVATAKLLLEFKLHNDFTYMGHIEDVVVHQNHRGKGYGKRIMEYVRDAAIKKYGCYKIVLDCSETNVPFYEKCGCKRKGHEMVVYKTPY